MASMVKLSGIRRNVNRAATKRVTINPRIKQQGNLRRRFRVFCSDVRHEMLDGIREMLNAKEGYATVQ